MNMYDKIKQGWKKASSELAGSEGFWERSALGLSLLRNLKTVFTTEHLHGRLLDAGAGKLPHQHLVSKLSHEYVSLDFKPTHPKLDIVADVQHMPMPDSSFDSAICIEVLEHVPDPERALRELWRVLKPEGKLVFSVPHFLYLHNEPYDFYRYTKYGLQELAQRVGFRVIIIKPSGGIFCFLQGIVATAAVGLMYGVPIIWTIVLWINRTTAGLAIWLDKHIDKRHMMPLHYFGVLQKP